MTLTDAAVDRLTVQMQGVWQTMTDAKLKAYSDWLLRRCPAAESDVRAIIDELGEQSERIPSIKAIRDKLALAGHITDAPIPGTGDPRLIAHHKTSAMEAAQSTARIRRLDLDVALELIRQQDEENLAIDLASDLGSSGTHKDRIQAVTELQRERGGRADLTKGLQEALT